MSELDPQQEPGLKRVLEGEFDFFGMISSVRELDTPPLYWRYERLSGNLQRTVECSSTIGVPHGLDTLVYTTLLDIDRTVKKSPGSPYDVTIETIDTELSLLFPEADVDPDTIYAAVLRLNDAIMTITDVRRDLKQTSKRIFSLINFLSIHDSPDEAPAYRKLLTVLLNEDMIRLNRQRYSPVTDPS